MYKVLIIGGNRFVGKSLSMRLLSCGYEVDVFNRTGTSADRNIGVIKGNRNNKIDVEKIDFDQYHAIVDMCLYLPSQFDLIKDLISSKTNYIFVSSGAADNRYSDSFGDYGRDKSEIENMLKLTDMNFDIIRPSYIVGMGNHRPRIGYFVDKLSNNEVIKVAGDGFNIINIVFIEDVVKVLEKLVLRDAPEMKTYDISGDESFMVMELIQIIKERLKIFKSIDEIKISKHRSESVFYDFNFSAFNNEKVCNDLNISFTNIDDGLDNYMEWYFGQQNI